MFRPSVLKDKITALTLAYRPNWAGAFYLYAFLVMVTGIIAQPATAAAPAEQTFPSPPTIQMIAPFAQDDEGNSALIEFDPIIYTAILDGKPYLQVTVKVIGKITPGINTVIFHDQKNQMAAAMLTIVARLAKKKFRIGKPLDPDMIGLYLQAAVNRTIKNKTAVKIFIVQAEQKPLQ